MSFYYWDVSKNDKLIRERKVCFEDVLLAIEEGRLLDIIGNPNQDRYKGQKVYVVEINKYIYFVPFLRRGNEVLLKTIIPNRKLTKRYLS